MIPNPERPNFLIVITHDTGRHLGCYGAAVDTPNLDRLAKEGVKFTQAFCTAPQCSPSRASLLTGMMPHTHGLIGLTHRGFRLKRGVPLLPELLTKIGYTTLLFGLQHEAPDAKEIGYQKVYNHNHSCLKVTPLVLDFLANSPPEPFFAMVGFYETHRPFPQTSTPVKFVKVPPFLPDVPEIRKDIAELNESVRSVDKSVGEILHALKKHHLADNTFFIFTTDHGIAFPGAKATLFDPGIEIALLAVGPGGFSGGKEIRGMVSNADISPTLLELCKVPIPVEMEGKSLLPLVYGKVDRLREELFFEMTYHAAYDPMRCVRTDRFKYIRSFEKRPWWLPPNVDSGPVMKGYTKEWFHIHQPEVFKKTRPSELLYDLAKDPMEQQNVAEDPIYAKVLTDLRKRLEEWMRETNDPLLRGSIVLPDGARVTPPESWDP